MQVHGVSELNIVNKVCISRRIITENSRVMRVVYTHI